MFSLGIETSCDETSVAVVKDGRFVLSNIIASSLKEHRKYQGIIPEIAFRAHIESITITARKALAAACKRLSDIDLICVTQSPGLIGSLLVGISFAKALSLALQKPLIGVNHLEAHLYASFLSGADVKDSLRIPPLPFVGLVVSGGHTNLFLVERDFRFKQLSSTADDAAGEAFDKVAKILDLGYPGGPVIERLAREGNVKNFSFSCQGPSDLGFSFSGIKTAVLYKVHSPQSIVYSKRDLAASFQKAVVEALLEKSFLACQRKKIKTLVVGGGVAANNYLRNKFQEEAAARNIKVYFPGRGLTLDNAAMIAGLGYQLFKRGKRSNYYLNINP
ncbi:MAG: tRNA (adenosine(37)-N6)-threonylcarbamoyltransferase complex transferase subunit TsaD [Candidatus Omnitrophota bacterium]